MNRPVVLLVDDDPLIREGWSEALGRAFRVLAAGSASQARAILEQHPIDVALLDVELPGESGLVLLEHVRAAQPGAEVVIVTGHGTVPLAVSCMQKGASDFVSKPVALDEALQRVRAAADRKRLREDNERLRRRLGAFASSSELIGSSAAIRALREQIERFAPAPNPVLVRGESGTGKELVSRALHERSPRAAGPFVAVNCAAIPETLLESELFGHEKGAFTGAAARHRGLFEAADGGTLFLDEIGDVSSHTQVRLLRVLETGEVRPVGSTVSRRVDVRVVAATNSPLEDRLRTGAFREDLFFRLRAIQIDVPPLRSRREDIDALARYFLDRYLERQGKQPRELGEDALSALRAHAWPGNVRELRHTVEYAATLASGSVIDAASLPTFVGIAAPAVRAPRASDAPALPYHDARAQALEAFDRSYVGALLARAGGSLSMAARIAGMDRSNLRRLVRRLGLGGSEEEAGVGVESAPSRRS